MKHLKESNTTYHRHLFHAIKISFGLFVMSIVGVVHAFIPYIFPDFVSSKVKQLDELLDKPII